MGFGKKKNKGEKSDGGQAGEAAATAMDQPMEGDLIVAIYSGQQYAREQLEKVVTTFPGSFFIEDSCSIETAPRCKSANSVCLFVNDEAGADVIKVFQEEGIKLILLRCAGYDRVDLDACDKAGIKVARVPAYSPYAVAEHALGLAMCLNRNLHLCRQRVVQGNFALSGLVGMDLRSKTIGIVGTGNIGRIAAEIFTGIGMKLLAFDVYKNDRIAELGGRYVEMDELYAEADVISLHVPLLPSTAGMINKESIAKMKDGVLLVNCSRGGLVNTEDLIDGLKSGKIGGVGSDVYENEAPLFGKDLSQMSHNARMDLWDPLLAQLTAFPNVLLTPHSAFLTREALDNITDTTLLNCKEFLAGGPMTNQVQSEKATLARKPSSHKI